MLELRDLSVAFGSVQALKGVSMAVPLGENMGLIGPNGSGKSTLVNALSGLVRATGGMSLDGSSIRTGSPRSSQRAGIARTFQTPQTFLHLSRLDNAMLGLDRNITSGIVGSWPLRRRTAGDERARRLYALRLLERVGLASTATQPAATLSYGQQRMLELARALALRPKLIVLDEPAAGLNHAETDSLATLLAGLRDDGISVFLVEHKMDFVRRVCPRIAVLESGRLIADGPIDEVFADSAVIDAYLGTSTDA